MFVYTLLVCVCECKFAVGFDNATKYRIILFAYKVFAYQKTRNICFLFTDFITLRIIRRDTWNQLHNNLTKLLRT